ncbi:hypothetical protein L1885_18760 [Streptomyces fuscigenes]|nr:hypothetical protein [Streptomyces fuscigenes]MCF3963661.1 hypothetical protein [Streptomyces fuscigenes]
MPTPYGPRGGMAFGADELRVLRRALAAVLHPAQLPDEDVRACLALAESVDEAVEEAVHLHAGAALPPHAGARRLTQETSAPLPGAAPAPAVPRRSAPRARTSPGARSAPSASDGSDASRGSEDPAGSHGFDGSRRHPFL